MKYDVFISYSRKDIKIADLICALLDMYNISYWIDRNKNKGGSHFEEAIATAIDESAIVLFLSSKSSNNSDNVKREISYATDTRRISKCEIIPLLIDNAPFQKGIGFCLAGKTTIDNYEDTNAKREELLDAISSIIGKAIKKKESFVSVFETVCNRIQNQKVDIGKYLKNDINFLMRCYSATESIAPCVPYAKVWDYTDKSELIFENSNFEFILNSKDVNIKRLQIDAINEFEANGKFKEDSIIIRLERVVRDNNVTSAIIQKARYSDQVQGQLCLDWCRNKKSSNNFTTLRAYLAKDYNNELPPLSCDLLANSIGVSVIIYFKENDSFVPFLPLRNKKSLFSNKNANLAVYEGLYHASSSGSVKWNDNIKDINHFTNEMYREILEELYLSQSDFIELTPLALTREYLRGGKPQLFFIGITNLPPKQLLRKIKIANEQNDINNERREVKEQYLTDFNSNSISLEALGNLYYCEKYLRERDSNSNV